MIPTFRLLDSSVYKAEIAISDAIARQRQAIEEWLRANGVNEETYNNFRITVKTVGAYDNHVGGQEIVIYPARGRNAKKHLACCTFDIVVMNSTSNYRKPMESNTIVPKKRKPKQHYECPMCGVDIEEHQRACMNCTAGNF